MAEGIKSLATTAGYFAPGAGIADALGLYPTEEGMGASILQNIRQGNLGQAGFQGLGVDVLSARTRLGSSVLVNPIIWKAKHRRGHIL